MIDKETEEGNLSGVDIVEGASKSHLSILDEDMRKRTSFAVAVERSMVIFWSDDSCLKASKLHRDDKDDRDNEDRNDGTLEGEDEGEDDGDRSEIGISAPLSMHTKSTASSLKEINSASHVVNGISICPSCSDWFPFLCVKDATGVVVSLPLYCFCVSSLDLINCKAPEHRLAAV